MSCEVILMVEKEGVDPSTPKDALEILQTFNRWRRDEGEFKSSGTIIPLPFSSKQVGEAIDTAISILEKVVDLK